MPDRGQRWGQNEKQLSINHVENGSWDSCWRMETVYIHVCGFGLSFNKNVELKTLFIYILQCMEKHNATGL